MSTLGIGVTLAALVAALGAVVACGETTPAPKDAKVAAGGTKDPGHWPADDKSMCEWRDKLELEVSETTGPGAIRPNVRRVYRDIGEGENRHKVLVCREIDTNLDGIKDVVRVFNDKGEPSKEQADTNFDGQIDDWIVFADGRIAEEDVDTTLSTGRPNVWKFYLDGALSRIRRNTHCPSGKPDVWEIYVKDRLERVGNDSTCDGHVDRWDRDAQMMASEEGATTTGDAGATPTSTGGNPNGTDAVTVGSNGQISDGGVADAGKKKKGKGK